MLNLLPLGLIAIAGLHQLALARDVPSNVRDFYNKVKSGGSCKSPFPGKFFNTEEGKQEWVYCQDHYNNGDNGIIYLKGPGSNFANMDIDCDGEQNGVGNDGRCDGSTDTQSETAFMDTVASYHKGVDDLNAYVHPYVVFGNEGSKAGYVNFDPRKHFIKPLSVMAVVCGDKLIYGIWGDTNGDDGPPLVGEASLSLATACFGKKDINGDSGHDEADVLYIAFTDKDNSGDTVPGKNGAKWDAKSYDEFENSIQAMGDRLVARVKVSSTSEKEVVMQAQEIPAQEI